MKFCKAGLFGQTLVAVVTITSLIWRAQAGTLIGSFTPVASGSNVNLTLLGSSDWVHWGLYTDSSVNRKACVPPLISDFTLLGDATNNFLAAYQYLDNSNGYSWSDGAPVASITNTTTGVWAYQAGVAGSLPVGSGFQFAVPAETLTRTLKVFVGAFAAKGKCEASLSDGSAASFVSGNSPGSTVDNQGNGPGGVFTITYAATNAGQKLTVKWYVAAAYGAPQAPNVTLQAATLTAPGADNPPFAMLTSPVNYAAFLGPTNLDLHAEAQDFDGTVTNVAFFVGTNYIGGKASSPYEFTWTNVPNGRHILTVVATDNLGVPRSCVPVEIFVYGASGSQDGFVGSPAASVDLTADGTADWTHWGLTDAGSFDYKNLVSRKISNFTRLGTNLVEQYDDNATSFAWSDGVPTTTIGGTTTGIFIGGRTNGFELTALADTSLRTLRVYVGGYGAQGIFQAWLSDFSGRPYTDTTVSNVYDNAYAVYSVSYAAASAGQTLTVVYRTLDLFDLNYGNVTLQAATLQGGPSDPLLVHIANPQRIGSDFNCAFATQTGRTYVVQYTDSLKPADWQPLTNLSGSGEIVGVADHSATGAERFYRVLTQ